MIEAGAQKEQLIQSIVHKNEQMFDKWKKNPLRGRTLDRIPTPILEHIFMPSALLEQAQDPTKVRIVLDYRNKENLKFLIVEGTGQAYATAEGLQAYEHAIRLRADAIHENGLDSKNVPNPPIPDGLDPFYKDPLARSMLKNNQISMQDKILTQWELTLDRPLSKSSRRIGGRELFIMNYDDRPEFHKKGIATQAYTNLEQFALIQGIHFITGDNNEKNISYFTNKLGRVTIGELQEPFQHAFMHMRNVNIPWVSAKENERNHKELFSYSTVRFLYDTDRRRMMRDNNVT